MDYILLLLYSTMICLGFFISFFSWVTAEMYVTGDNIETAIWRNIRMVI